MTRMSSRTGFNLIELLVVIAIIAILIALLLPAVQKVRESACRMKCENNLKQLALAMHNYHDAQQSFPHGAYQDIDNWGETPQNRRCWMQDVLPYLEQANLFAQFDAFMAAGNSALSFPLNTTIVPTLMCPSDPANPKLKTNSPGGGPGNSQGFSGNYNVCAGNDYFNPGGDSRSLNGIFYTLSSTRLIDITDGTSCTALSSEHILVPDSGGDDIRGRYYNPTHSGGVAFSTRLPPNTNTPDQFDWCLQPNPNPLAPCIWTGTNMFILARSYHTGGVNLALADGSVHLVTGQVDPATYKALGSRNGSETSGSW